ncbi:hypothetical protein C807_02481 [Lachnospiraceae bacterium 28-4]|nr:hypothetical protein C807_02481 [Lachnospiraceae bacterium 28-4]
MSKKYESLAKDILRLVGEASNITQLAHCATRLRFNIKDKSLIEKEAIEELDDVMGTSWFGDQFQIIIGMHVGDVYDILCEVGGIARADAIKENLDEKGKFSIAKVFETISASLLPVAISLIGFGMIKLLLTVLPMMHLLTAESQTYQVLSWVSDTAFYFLPVAVGYTTAVKFNATPLMGVFVGAILINPTFVANVSGEVPMSIFGVPVYAGTYTSTVFPAFLSVAVLAWVEKMLKKLIKNEILDSLLRPLLTLLIIVPLSLCVLAPAGSFIGKYLAAALMGLYDLTGFLGVAIFCAVLPFLIVTGMHYSFMPYWLGSIATLGYEPIYLLSNIIYNINIGVACLALSLKTKNKQLKALGISCGTTSILSGTSEPALFGVLLKNKSVLFTSMAGCFAGGAIAGLFKVVVYNIPANWALFAFPIFVEETGKNLIYAAVAIVAACITTFVLTCLFYKEEKE